MSAALLQTSLTSLPLLARGKVRDVYAVGGDRLLMVATDRLSAFDVVMGEPIPGKGELLTRMALFWFARLAHVVPHHLTGDDPESVVAAHEREQVRGRSMLVKRLKGLPVEAVVRGYLAGSGWKEYRETGSVCGVALPPGLKNASRLPEPIFTPATKAESGHDENISFEEAAARVGGDSLAAMRRRSIDLYAQAAELAAGRGILIADTKFEFGRCGGELILIDEVLTPDSSRFWPADRYQPGRDQESYDKQFVRNYLEQLVAAGRWDKRPPGPELPPDVIEGTRRRYIEAYQRLTGLTWG